MSTAKPADLLRVVLDTNVYFSAFTSVRGAPADVWRRAVRGEYLLLVSPTILRELAEVLRRDLQWSEPEIVGRLKLILRVAQIANPYFTLAVITADPDDDRIVECAVAGEAHLIVSGDHHLTELKTYQGIGIVRPVDFLRILRK